MKILTWNCNGAFRKKVALVDRLDADILVIQECKDPLRSTEKYLDWAGDYLWIGESKNKGLGVFPRKNNHIEPLNWEGKIDLSLNTKNSKEISIKNQDLKYFLPCKVNNDFNLIGVWAKAANFNNFQYIGQIWLYLQIHRNKLRSKKQVICGDFNSNSIWDKWDQFWNHSEVVKEFQELGFQSLYHFQSGEPQGGESQATFFMYRKTDKPYHIDYVFLSESLLRRSKLEIPDHREWLDYSDHIPVVSRIDDSFEKS